MKKPASDMPFFYLFFRTSVPDLFHMSLSAGHEEVYVQELLLNRILHLSGSSPDGRRSVEFLMVVGCDIFYHILDHIV